jgi:outer membrane protein assembly factor BamB
VWGNKVFITTAATEAAMEDARKGLYLGGERPDPPDAIYRWELHCYDLRNGKLIWKKTAVQHKPGSPIHVKNTYASETPVTDGQHIWAYFGSAGLYCFDLNGKLIWKKDLGTFRTRYGWGTASSPAVDSKHVYIQADNEDRSFIVALNKLTGKEAWRVEREENSNWSTPFLWTTAQRSEVVTCGSNKVRSYDPANGKLLWELKGMSVIMIPTPIAAHGLLYVSSGFVGDPRQRPIYAIRPGARGDISIGPEQASSQFIAWHQRFGGAYNPSPIVYGDYLYVLYDRGIMACFNAKTGKEVYKERVTSQRGQFTSSPWAYDGKIFCLSEYGETYVIKAGPDFKVLRVNELDEMFMSSPAIVDRSLILRGIDHLYCIRKTS